MKISLFASVFLILCLSVCGPVAGEELWSVDDVTVTTSDSLKLTGWLYVPKADGPAPLIVCLPMLAHTHSTYRVFIDSLEQRLAIDSTAPVPYILTLDLRGHGESTTLGDTTISYQNMGAPEWARAPKDVIEAIGYLLAQSRFQIETEEITLIGASIGANSAIMSATEITGANTVVMLSPGLDYRGLKPADALASFDGRCLIFAAREDAYSAESSGKLGETNEACTVRIFDGSLHGTDLINEIPEAMTGTLDFLLGE